MSWFQMLTKHLLYHKPQYPPFAFQAGVEDHPVENSSGGNGEKGGGSGLKQDSYTGGSENGAAADSNGQESKRSNKRRGGTLAGRRAAGKRKKRETAVQEKYAGKLAENQAVEEIVDHKVELAYDLDKNKQVLERIFRVPQNKDVVFRSLSIGTDPPVRALLVFIDGITDSRVQNTNVLQPLMLLSGLRDVHREKNNGSGEHPVYKDFFDRVKQAVLPSNQVNEAQTYAQVVDEVLNGNSALLVEGYNQALLLETKGWQYRGVSTPQVEAVIRGPQEAFTEQIRTNTSLVRKILHRPALVTEFIKLGHNSPMQCAIMYLADVANPDLVKEVKRRLDSIESDFMQESGLVEQMIEDSPRMPVPQVLATERPDRVAANLVEGKVAILVDGNPFVLVVPCTFFALMQAPEDAYVRWPFGTFVRMIRYLGLFMALLLPAHYVAIVAYHQEFIPTDLLLAMTGAREKVPFPSIVEVLVMEVSFELIREAGIRIPGTVGTTLGIVGALILGQAAVSANIVSPILIIVVAVTALGSFAIPNYSLSLSVRLLRFVYIALAAVAGLLGIMVGFFIHVGIGVSLKSFGVPFMAPVAPTTRKGFDYFWRAPAWKQETRPDFLDPLKQNRQSRVSRGWTRPGGQDEGGGSP